MGFNKKTIKDINIRGKTVLLRADYNVPIENGKITSDYRVQQSLPTLRYLLDKKCKIIICSHLGRPESPDDESVSLKPVVALLRKLTDVKVTFASDCVGEVAKKVVEAAGQGEIVLLENLRYHKAEEANDKDFAAQLADLADVFVQDAFGVAHRKHASTHAITKHIESVAGLLIEKEVTTINEVIESPKRPLMAIIGGAKISDKIGILNRFVEIADIVAIGGAMANTFLLAGGIDVAKSLVESEDVPLAKDIIAKAKARSDKENFVFYIPQDGVVAKKIDKTASTRIVDWDAHVIADIESYPKRVSKSATTIADDEMILDIGPFSGSFIAGCLQLAETVVWNGGMGVTEQDGIQGPVGPFAHGTDVIMNAMLGAYGNKPFTLVGGGDTVGYVDEQNLLDHFGHVSTGGGASLELMSGKRLPGIEALSSKD